MAKIKAIYDPHNRFRVNRNIAPAGGGVRRAREGQPAVTHRSR